MCLVIWLIFSWVTGFCIVCLMILGFSTLDCVDDVLSMRVRNLLRLFLCLTDRVQRSVLRNAVAPCSERTLETSTSSSTTCGTGALMTCSSVCCCVLFWDTVFGNFTNCSTISGTGTSRTRSLVPCKIRSRLGILGPPRTCSTTCGNWTSTTCSQIFSEIRSRGARHGVSQPCSATMLRNIRVRASQRARGCAHFQARLEPTRMRWEDDQVRMTSLMTSEDTRALETGSVHGGGYVHKSQHSIFLHKPIPARHILSAIFHTEMASQAHLYPHLSGHIARSSMEINPCLFFMF